MQIHLSPRNVRLTGAIHSYVAEKIMRLEDIGGEILAAHVVLVHDEQAASGAYFCVKVHLAVAGPDIHASETDGDLYAAIDKVSDKVAMQLRKKKKRILDQRRKKSPKGLLALIVALALFATSGGSALAAVRTKSPAELALLRLKVGNDKFVDNISTPANKSAKRRAQVAQGQKPVAIVVSCSDSRVGPEVVFNQGLGDLFVVRTAGHVVDDVGLGSIEYAVEHLGASLIVVLGHERCGAVAATVADGKAHGHLPAVLKAIKPAVAKSKGQPGDAVENAVIEQVREVTAQLQKAGPVLAARVKAGQLKVVGARYDLDTGRVQFNQ